MANVLEYLDYVGLTKLKSLFEGVFAKKTNEIHFIQGSDTDTTAGTWTGTDDTITAYYDGLSVIYVPVVAGASTTTLNINELGEIVCKFNSTSKNITTHYGAGVPILLTYTNGVFARADYDANTNTVWGYCSTTAATAAKVATFTNYALRANSYVTIVITSSNTAKSKLTLNANSKGAKSIYINGTITSSSNYTLPAGTYLVFYNGTNYYFRTDGKLTVLDGTTVTTAQDLYAKSSITDGLRTDVDAKLPLAGGTMTGDLTLGGYKIVGATASTFINFLSNGNIRFEAPCSTNDLAYFTFGKAGINLGNGTVSIIGVTDHTTVKSYIDMTTHAITNVADPTNDADAANKKYVDDKMDSVIDAFKDITITGEENPITTGDYDYTVKIMLNLNITGLTVEIGTPISV